MCLVVAIQIICTLFMKLPFFHSYYQTFFAKYSNFKLRNYIFKLFNGLLYVSIGILNGNFISKETVEYKKRKCFKNKCKVPQRRGCGWEGGAGRGRLARRLRVGADYDLHHVPGRDLRFLHQQPVPEELAAVEPALPPRFDVLLSM